MATIKQFSFSSGELAPALHARTDFQKYQSGLKKARNALVQREGGILNRPGTEFIGELLTEFRLIPFVYDDDNAFAILMAGARFYFYKDGDLVSNPGNNATVNGVTLGVTTTISTSAAHGYSSGDVVYFAGVGGTTQLNSRYFRVTNTTATTFRIRTLGDNNNEIDSTLWTAWTSGGTVSKIFSVSSGLLSIQTFEFDYVQDENRIYIVHPDYNAQYLEWGGANDYDWTRTLIVYEPDIAPPTSFTVDSPGTTSDRLVQYKVTCISRQTNEESYPATDSARVTADPSLNYPHTMSWVGTSQALAYNVYVDHQGAVGYVGSTTSTSFRYTGTTPDFTITPPFSTTGEPFFDDGSGAGYYPGAVGLFQQRLVFASTEQAPNVVALSKPGLPFNFTRGYPSQDSDPVLFKIKSQQAVNTKFIVDMGRLVLLTNQGEFVVEGGSNGIITPTEINSRKYSNYGCGDVKPVVIGNTTLFVQARNAALRELNFEFNTESTRGSDITVFSSHLFKGYTLQDMTYSQTPNSVIYLVRSDGALLACTYMREHEILGWTKCDLEGLQVKSVAVIPEGDEDVLLLSVYREEDGRYFLYRMHTRTVGDVRDLIFVDGSGTFDGRLDIAGHPHLTGYRTLTLSGGTNWTYDETLTLTASTSYFASTDVGNEIQLYESDELNQDECIRLRITGYTSATVVSVMPNRTVPASLRSTATKNWIRAVDEISGLWHLEGKDVAVFADGGVVANPNNETYDVITVTNGSITLPRPYGVVHVGLPYTTDIQTLSIDSANGETLIDKQKLVTQVHMQVENTRGVFVGTEEPDTDASQDGLYELKLRNLEGYDESVDLTTDTVSIITEGTWNKNGSVFIRQTDPVPLHILSIAPEI